MNRLTRKNDATGRWTYDCSSREIIDKLAEYENLEKQGKLLKLPVAVGDTVYEILSGYSGKYFIAESEVEEISTSRIFLRKDFLDIDDFGRSIFATREEAEAEIKRRVGEQNE